jgi:hypothetical protein
VTRNDLELPRASACARDAVAAGDMHERVRSGKPNRWSLRQETHTRAAGAAFHLLRLWKWILSSRRLNLLG